MRSRHVAAVRIATLMLPGLLYVVPAASQDSRQWLRSADPSIRSETAAKIPPAPVGHRQPTAADFPRGEPKDEADLERERRDRELDARLQICRGC
jgi:hypothetical protein